MKFSISFLSVVGIYILLSGELIIGKAINLKGKMARLYGLSLILLSPVIDLLLGKLIQWFIVPFSQNGILLIAAVFLGQLFVAILLGVLFAKLISANSK